MIVQILFSITITKLPDLKWYDRLPVCSRNKSIQIQVFMLAISRVLTMIFWYFGFEELANEDKKSFNIAGWCVLLSHVSHLLLMADFIYCYIKAVFFQGCLQKNFNFTDLDGAANMV